MIFRQKYAPYKKDNGRRMASPVVLSFIFIIMILVDVGCRSTGARVITAVSNVYPATKTPIIPMSKSWSAPPTQLPEISLPAPVEDQAVIDRAEGLFQEGREAYNAGEWQKSLKSLNAALELNPRHTQAYLFRGKTYLRQNYGGYLGTYLENNSQAIWNFSIAIALDPSSWEAYYGRGVGYHLRAQVEPLRENRKQWLELAFNDLDRALELDQWQGLVRGERVSIYIETRQCDKALNELLSPESSHIPLEDEIMYFIKTDRCLKDYSEAMRLINEQLERSSDANLYWQRGLIYADQDEYEKALVELDTAAQEWSGWTGSMIPGTLWYNRAAIEYYRGNYDRVKEYIQKGHPLTWIDWGSPYYFLGKVYLREGNSDQAIQAFLWAEQTLDEGEFLNATRNELYNLGALPAGVPPPTSTPEKATTLGTPENTPIPTEVSGQIMQAYGTMVFIQINATLLDTAATRAQAGKMDDTQKDGFIHFFFYFYKEVESQIAQSVIPSIMDTEWKKALDIHDKTKDIYTRWIDQDIEPSQVTVEMAPLLSELAVTIQNTQKILSGEYGFDINELIQLQQDALENVGKSFGP